jgi:hypothetical protein
MQDINPLPWGAQDRYQSHFIVKGNVDQSDDIFLAEAKLKTQGRFGSKKVVGVEWIGGKIADILNKDDELVGMIQKLSYIDACIWVDPTKNGVRIHGKWKNDHELGISKEQFAVYDRIALHIKKNLSSPPI